MADRMPCVGLYIAAVAAAVVPMDTESVECVAADSKGSCHGRAYWEAAEEAVVATELVDWDTFHMALVHWSLVEQEKVAAAVSIEMSGVVVAVVIVVDDADAWEAAVLFQDRPVVGIVVVAGVVA